MQNKSSRTSRLRRAASERGDGFRRVLLERTCTTTQRWRHERDDRVKEHDHDAMAGLGIFSHASARPSPLAAVGVSKGLRRRRTWQRRWGRIERAGVGESDTRCGGWTRSRGGRRRRARWRRRGGRSRGCRLCAAAGQVPERRRGGGGLGSALGLPKCRAPRRACRTGSSPPRFSRRRGLVRLEGVLERQRLLARTFPPNVVGLGCHAR